MNVGILALALASMHGDPSTVGQRPNVLVVRIDDARCDDMKARRPDGTLVLQNVHDLITSKGINFTSNFAPLSLCCPSRASFLSGQYAHNHGVYGNQIPFGGVGRFDHANSLPVWLHAAGYYTGHVGKYMNGYSGGIVYPGWDYWMSQSSGAHFGYYYNYILNENGTQISHGSSIRDYATDVFTQKALDFLDGRLFGDQPFFLVVDYTAPHNGQGDGQGDGRNVAIPAPRHQSVFANATFSWGPSFDEADVSDKPPGIQALPLFSQDDLDYITMAHRARLGSLLAVDEGVGRIMQALANGGFAANTYVIFLSDNGFVEGEHRLVGGKNDPYEESIRVPMAVRGPGVRRGIQSDQIVANIDMAPTILELAGSTSGRVMDGMSIVPILRGEPFSRQDLLIEGFTYGLPPNSLRRSYTGLRTSSYAYVETDENGNGIFDAGIDAQELYTLSGDASHPVDLYELESQHANPIYAALMDYFHQRVQVLAGCAGAGCQ